MARQKTQLESKTILFNLFFIVALFLQWYSEIYVTDVELQGIVAGVINLGLRNLTKTGIKSPLWYKKLSKGK